MYQSLSHNAKSIGFHTLAAPPQVNTLVEIACDLKPAALLGSPVGTHNKTVHHLATAEPLSVKASCEWRVRRCKTVVAPPPAFQACRSRSREDHTTGKTQDTFHAKSIV
jgi:hypothetical protein